MKERRYWSAWEQGQILTGGVVALAVVHLDVFDTEQVGLAGRVDAASELVLAAQFGALQRHPVHRVAVHIQTERVIHA